MTSTPSSEVEVEVDVMEEAITSSTAKLREFFDVTGFRKDQLCSVRLRRDKKTEPFLSAKDHQFL